MNVLRLSDTDGDIVGALSICCCFLVISGESKVTGCWI